MAIPKDGDFYIQRSNQDFWLREAGVWVRKGNIRDEGSSGLVAVNPTLNLGLSMGAQITRTRFLGSVAMDLGITMAAAVSLIRQIEATSYQLGFNMDVTLQHFALESISASMAMGFTQSVAAARSRALTDSVAMGFSMAAAITHAAVAPPGFVVLGLGISAPFTAWYDGSLNQLTPSWTVPTAEVLAAEFSPDGSKLALATAGAIFRYDTSGTSPVYMGAFPSPPSWAHIAAIAWNAAGTRFAVADGQLSPFCWVYDTSTWTTVAAPATTANETQINFGGTANLFFASGNNTNPSSTLYDIPGMGLSATQLGGRPTNQTLASDFSPSGAYFASIANGSPIQFKVWQMSAPGAPLADPASMPHANGGAGARSMRWSHGGTKLVVCDGFGTYCYNVTGTTITQDQTINFNIIGGVSPAWKADDSKLYLAQSSTPRFAVYSRVGGVYTKDTDPAQPATVPRCIASSV